VQRVGIVEKKKDMSASSTCSTKDNSDESIYQFISISPIRKNSNRNKQKPQRPVSGPRKASPSNGARQFVLAPLVVFSPAFFGEGSREAKYLGKSSCQLSRGERKVSEISGSEFDRG